MQRVVLKLGFGSFWESWREVCFNCRVFKNKKKSKKVWVPFHCHSLGTCLIARKGKPSCRQYFNYCLMLSAVASNEECLRVELCTDRLCALTLFWQLFVVCSVVQGNRLDSAAFFFFLPKTTSISCIADSFSCCWHARFCWPFRAPFCSFQQGPRPFVAFLTRLSFCICNRGFSLFVIITSSVLLR